MPFVSLSNLHPRFKLGILLVFAALLLDSGGSGAFSAAMASDQLDLSPGQYNWLFAAGGLGGLFVVAAVIWVDSRPPHGAMAAGALVLAIGLALLTLSESLSLAVVAFFIAGAGRAAVGSIIFYAVAVKGFTRFKGVLIGAMSFVFSVRWDAVANSAWASDLPIGWCAVILVLAGGTLLFVLLPRWFTELHRPGQTLRETVAVPGVKTLIFWAAAVYLVSAMIMAARTTHLQHVILAMSPGNNDLGFGYDVTALVVGVGALLWGISADFFPVRRLLIVLAVLSLPAVGCLWLPGGQVAGILLLSLNFGGLISLPWVLMAESLPKNHFAKLALGITWVGLMGAILGPIYWGWALDKWNTEAFFWIVVAEMAVLATVVALRPSNPKTES